MKGYRTVAVNSALGTVFGFLLTIDWQAAGFSLQHATWIMGGVGLANVLLNIWLRFLTTTPIGEPE